jgi:hypothetical protein
VAKVNYLYEKIVAAGPLRNIVLAHKGESSLQDRVGKVLPHFFALREDDFPNDLKPKWKIVKAAKGRSLTAEEAKNVLGAFVDIVIDVTRLYGQELARRGLA